jgi:hypothetical protein
VLRLLWVPVRIFEIAASMVGVIVVCDAIDVESNRRVKPDLERTA